MAEKGMLIKDIQADTRVEGVFCVASKRLLETRNGSPYLALTIMDRSGEIEARVWDNATEAASGFDNGDFIRIQADAQRYRDMVQLRISSVEPVAREDIDPRDFMPVAPVDLGLYEKQFDRLIRGIKRDPLGPFLKALFRKGGALRQGFVLAPAAKKMHQAYIGGLLEHSVAVASLAQETARLYPEIDGELLLAGALVHDIGKVHEFRYDSPPIDYTDRGRLIGHSALGIEMIDRCAEETGIDASHQDIMALKHMVLSHHGQREFGASVLPMTPEAMALHLIDDLDAKMSFLRELGNRQEHTGPAWTPYQRLFERYFYLRGIQHGCGEDHCQEQSDDDRAERGVVQPGIFDL